MAKLNENIVFISAANGDNIEELKEMHQRVKGIDNKNVSNFWDEQEKE